MELVLLWWSFNWGALSFSHTFIRLFKRIRQLFTQPTIHPVRARLVAPNKFIRFRILFALETISVDFLAHFTAHETNWIVGEMIWYDMNHLVPFVFCTIRIRIWRAYTNNNIYPFSFSRRTRKGVKTKSGSTSSASSSSSSSREDIAFPFSTGSSLVVVVGQTQFTGGILWWILSRFFYENTPRARVLLAVYKTTASTFPSPLIFFGHNIPRTINHHHHHYHPKQPSSPHFTRTNTTFSSAKTNYICNFTSHTHSHIIPWNRIPSVEFTELISILNGFKIPQNPLLHFLLCHPDWLTWSGIFILSPDYI